MPAYGRVDPEYAAHLATCPVEEDGPVFMVNFMKYHERARYADGTDGGRSGREADDAYAPTDVLADLGAVVVFFGDVEPGGEWDRVGIVRYPTRRSFIAMQSRGDFQEKHVHKLAGMASTIVCGCLPEGIRAPGGGTRARVVFEMTTQGTAPQLRDAGRLRVEGTILGDGRRFGSVAVAWVEDGATMPTASPERVVAVVRPSIDRLAGELAAVVAPAATA